MKIQAKHGCEQFWPPKAQLQNSRVGLVLRATNVNHSSTVLGVAVQGKNNAPTNGRVRRDSSSQYRIADHFDVRLPWSAY
jgi:hypothetical protein